MNQFDKPTEDDMRFDRLVDGEMDGLERRQLLAVLDDEPGGWRRCAMAFLEAQAWRVSMQAADCRGSDTNCDERTRIDQRQGVLQSRPWPVKPLLPSGSRGARGEVWDRSGLVRLTLSMSVCFVIAFFLGTEFRRRWSPLLVTSTVTAPRQLPSGAESTGEWTDEEEAPQLAETPTQTTEVIPWGEATFVLDEQGHEVDVPVFDLDPYARQVLLENSTAAIDSLRDHFQRGGFDVQRDVSWSPIDMGGGQRMLVPIGDFVISPISHRTMQ